MAEVTFSRGFVASHASSGASLLPPVRSTCITASVDCSRQNTFWLLRNRGFSAEIGFSNILHRSAAPVLKQQAPTPAHNYATIWTWQMPLAIAAGRSKRRSSFSVQACCKSRRDQRVPMKHKHVKITSSCAPSSALPCTEAQLRRTHTAQLVSWKHNKFSAARTSMLLQQVVAGSRKLRRHPAKQPLHNDKTCRTLERNLTSDRHRRGKQRQACHGSHRRASAGIDSPAADTCAKCQEIAGNEGK